MTTPPGEVTRTPSHEWITERLADYKACRSHREVSAIEAMFAEAGGALNDSWKRHALALQGNLELHAKEITHLRRVVEAARLLAWDERWGTWLAHMPVPVAKEIVGMRVKLQNNLAALDAAEGGE